MARIVGVDLPKNKRGEIGLTYAIWITEIRFFASLSHFPSILYGQSRRIIVSYYAVPTE